MDVKLVLALWMNNYFVNLIAFNFFVFNETMIKHFDFDLSSALFNEQHSPYIDVAMTISDEESTFIVEDHRVWMLCLHQAFVACRDICISD